MKMNQIPKYKMGLGTALNKCHCFSLLRYFNLPHVHTNYCGDYLV